MKVRGVWTARQTTPADEGRLRRLIEEAGRVALRFQVGDLADYLDREPFLLVEEAGRLRGFLAFSTSRSTQAALVAAGLADDWSISSWLDRLLPRCIARLQARGATSLSYVGSARWLIGPLQARGFRLLSNVVVYKKTDAAIADRGNREVDIRPVRATDLAALVALDELDFHPLWRNSMETLQQWQATIPYFVVAVAAQEPVGYCYCSVEEGEHGHLIRMAVHPTWQGRGIGTRLLSEALLFFRQAGVRHVTLNTQEENEGAQRLYCKFGFRLVGWEAVALWMDL